MMVMIVGAVCIYWQSIVRVCTQMCYVNAIPILCSECHTNNNTLIASEKVKPPC